VLFNRRISLESFGKISAASVNDKLKAKSMLRIARRQLI
jgi:hypothetical protein